MAFKSGAVAIGTTNTDVFTCPATLDGAVVLGITNVSSGSATYTLKHYKQATGATIDIATGFALASKTAYKWPFPISMEAGDIIQMSASAGSAIVAYPTTTVSAATPATTGFAGKGAWSAVATYAVNDVVSQDGNSYLSLQASNLNRDPATETAWWMILAEKGDPGAGIGDMISTNNLSDVADIDAARTNLGATAIGEAIFIATDAAAVRSAIGGSSVGQAVFVAADAAAARSAIGASTGPSSSTANNLVSFNDTTGKVNKDSGTAISTDGTFATNSDTKVPTEKAVKTYVDARTSGNIVPTVALTFDYYIEAFSVALSIMDSHGFPGTYFVAPETIDTSSFPTKDNLIVMKQLGWEIGGYTNSNMVTEHTANRGTAFDHLKTMQDTFETKGFKIRSIAPTQRAWNAPLANLTRGRYFGVRVVDDFTQYQSYPVPDPNWVKYGGTASLSSTDTLSSLSAQLDAVITARRLWVPVIHKVGSSPDSLTVSTTIFTQFLDYLKTKSDAGLVRVARFEDALTAKYS